MSKLFIKYAYTIATSFCFKNSFLTETELPVNDTEVDEIFSEKFTTPTVLTLMIDVMKYFLNNQQHLEYQNVRWMMKYFLHNQQHQKY